MNFIKKIKDIETNLNKYSRDIEYRIINNTLGKNIILITPLKKNYSCEEIENNLIKLFKNYIEEIIIEDINENDYSIEKIKKICPKNSYIHKNVSYNFWNSKDQLFLTNKKNIITGYSFKGGVGRSQTLAYLSMFFASRNKKVVVLDCDFEAPGIGIILKNKNREVPGILDYIIDIDLDCETNLSNYCYQSSKNLIVFPSGIQFNSKEYFNRLSKIDFNSSEFVKSFCKFIEKIRQDIDPHYIFIDLRAGINESNGYFLTKISDKNLLFFNNNEENKLGLDIIINQLKINNYNPNSYYLINSLIREYNQELYSIKKEEFKKYISQKFNNFKDRIIELPHNSDFIDSTYKKLNNFVTINKTLYEKKEEKNIASKMIKKIATLKEFLSDDKMEPLFKKLNLKENSLEDLYNLLEKNKSKSELNIFLFDIIDKIEFDYKESQRILNDIDDKILILDKKTIKAEIDKAIKLDNKNPKAYEALGDFYLGIKDYEHALNNYKISLKYNFNNSFVPYLKILDLCKLSNKKEEEEEILYQMLEQPYQFSFVYSSLALIEKNRGNLKKAENFIEKALEKNPEADNKANVLNLALDIFYKNKRENKIKKLIENLDENTYKEMYETSNNLFKKFFKKDTLNKIIK